VFSQPGRGTTFEIFFPRLDAPPGVEAQPATAASRRRDIPTGNETVLIVEDEAAVRLLAQRILKGAGYTVLTAADAAAALTLLTSGGAEVDILVTDVVLPGMSGRDLADRVARVRPSVKILFTSGYTDDAILRHGVLDREVAFLGKPYTVDQLTRKVREVLDA
jgi:CheY-like chemotaxis protein